MTTIPIIFNDTQHKTIIMKLCKRNNFYIDDVYSTIYRDIPPHIKSKLSKSDSEKTLLYLLEKSGDNILSGNFIVKTEELSKKVVGFIIYDITSMDNTPLKRSDLLFILIDKKYQNQSYGTTLMHTYIDDVNSLKCISATVKSENSKLNMWYNQFGFQLLPSVTQHSNKYQMLHLLTPQYHTVKSLAKMLNIESCFEF